MSQQNSKVVEIIERLGLDFRSWPQMVRPGAGEAVSTAYRSIEFEAVGNGGRDTVPCLPTRWGYISGETSEEGRGACRTCRVQFYALTAPESDLTRVKARCVAAVLNELRQLGMHLKGVRVEQGESGDLFSLVVSYNGAEQQKDREGDLVDFLTVLFIAGRIDDILDDAGAVGRLSTKFPRDLQHSGTLPVHFPF